MIKVRRASKYILAVLGLLFTLVPSIALAQDYAPDEPATIYAEVKNNIGDPVTNATVTLDLYDSTGNKELDGVNMTHVANGVYKYDFTTPADVGDYAAVADAGEYGFGTMQIHVVEETGTGGNVTCSINATAIWSEDTSGYTDSLTFGGLLNSIFGGENMALPQIILVLGFMALALWKKGWIRIILSLCIIIWGAFAMQYDIKIAAPLIAVGSVLFIEAIFRQIQQAREQAE